MRRQTFTMRERFIFFGEQFLTVFGLRAKKRKVTAYPIPARLRPWTTRNTSLIALTDIRRLFERTEYIADLRGCCTDKQWSHLCRQYPLLVHSF